MVKESNKRQIAYKISIEDINKYPYHKQEGWLPNYIDFQNKKVSRINIISTIILKPMEGDVKQDVIVVDDGSDQIEVRTFEDDFDFKTYEIGEIVKIIGRIREFNDKKYIIPEIIKKMKDVKVLELRKKELIIEKLKNKEKKNENKIIEKKPEPKEEKIIKSESLSTYDKIISEIRKIDKGNGVNIQDILINLNILNGEELITELLQKGDVFEISPGKVKVLE
tara:strand:+ start:28802 stop:29470 length:669 start_codon:yes stop_codon:yes gene_type:complete